MDGWIKIHRQMIGWEWFTEPNTLMLFIYLLLTANHKPKRWCGIEVGVGQLVTSVKSLSAETKLTTQQIRTALARLEDTGEITRRATNKFTLITVENYTFYQARSDDSNKQITNEQQTNNKQITNKATNKIEPVTVENCTLNQTCFADSNKQKTGENQENQESVTTNKNIRNINIYSPPIIPPLRNDGEVKETVTSLINAAPPELRQTLIEFKEFRTKIKAPLTTQSLKRLMSKAKKLANDDLQKTIAIFEQSIDRGWRGIFPLDESRRKNPSADRFEQAYNEILEDLNNG